MSIAASRDPAARPQHKYQQHEYQEHRSPVPLTSAEPAAWTESAACRDVDTELFFPIGNGIAAQAGIRQAKSICASCPVRRPCLAFALATNQEYGIWGGYDEDERRLLPRRQRESESAAGAG